MNALEQKKSRPDKPDRAVAIEAEAGVLSWPQSIWLTEQPSSVSRPEAIGVGLTRQLARVIGHELAKSTLVAQDSTEMLRNALALETEVSDPSAQLSAAIKIVSQSPDRHQATIRLVSEMATRLDGAEQLQRLAVIASLMRVSARKMFSELFTAPSKQGPVVSMSGEGTFLTTFNRLGDLESMSIAIDNGCLAKYFHAQLQHAHEFYQQNRFAALPTGAIRDQKVLLLELAITDFRFTEVTSFKTTQGGLVGAYIRALYRYASEGYASRVRRER